MRFSATIRMIAVGLGLSLSGCAQLKYYPLCVFGPDPRYSSPQALHKKLLEFVRSVVGDDARIAISPNERLVTVDAVPEKQEILMKAWPRVACVGQTRYDVEYGTYKSCVYLIETALKQDGIPPLGKWSDGIRDDTVYCGHILNKGRLTPLVHSSPAAASKDAAQPPTKKE